MAMQATNAGVQGLQGLSRLHAVDLTSVRRSLHEQLSR